ncbi:MAG: hypothetical protein AABY83_15325 [Pseudomonadota bacterium]
MCKVLWVASAVALVLAGCGGADNKLPSERPAGHAVGNAVDALITGGTVSIYAWDTGAKGDLLGTGTTDDTGRYSITLQTSDRPILIELTGGQYIEEATSKTVALAPTQRLRAVTHYRPGDSITAMVTPWTNVAAGLAEFKVSSGKNSDNAITEANVAISTFVGVDILNVYPRNITDASNAGALDDEYLYGAMEAGMSMWAAWAAQQNGPAGKLPVTSIAVSQIMYDDIRSDGLLDGSALVNGSPVPLAAGNAPLDANVYRSGFASQMLNAVADQNINRTSISVSNILSSAQKISMSRAQVFGAQLPVSVDRDPPIITSKFDDGKYVGGVVPYSADITDFVGVASVTYDVDGVDSVKIADIAHPTFLLATKNYTDGPHLIGVRAKDNVGNEAYKQFMLNFMNTGILMTLDSPLITNQTSYNIKGTYLDNGAGVAKITVQGKDATVNPDGTWSAVAALSVGFNKVTLGSIDKLGNAKSQTVTIGVDILKPVVSWGSGSVALFVNPNDPNPYQANFDQNQTSAMHLWVYSDKIAAGGVSLTVPALNAAGIPTTNWRAMDDNCSGLNATISPCTPDNQLTVTLSYARNGDWSSPVYTKLIKPNPMASLVNGFAAAIAEFLDDKWDTYPMGTTHMWRLSATDIAGNEGHADFSFQADVMQFPTPVSPVASNFTKGLQWASRATLYGAAQMVESYTYDNSNSGAHYISVADPGSAYTASQIVDTALRENKYITTTTEMWQGQLLTSCGSSGCNISGWTPISAFMDCRNGAVFKLPASVITDPIDLLQDTIPVNSSDTGWSNYDPLGSSECNVGPGMYAQYLTVSGILHFRGQKQNIWGQWYTTWDSGAPKLQNRTTVVHSLVAGYPRVIWGSFTESYGASGNTVKFGDTTFFVSNPTGVSITPNRASGKDWYLVAAGQKYIIQRFVAVPLINVHADADITKSLTLIINGAKPEYMQYAEQATDRSVEFKLNTAPLNITRVHATDINTLGTMVPETRAYGGQNTTLKMERPPAQ